MIPKYRVWLPCKQAIVNALMIDFENKEVMYRWKDKSRTATYIDTDAFGDVSIMQSTGLKDKNGVEIYVGDIVRNDKGEIGRVVYLKQEAGFVVALPKSDYRLGHRNTGEPYDMASGHEVISNIYANPELLSSGIE